MRHLIGLGLFAMLLLEKDDTPFHKSDDGLALVKKIEDTLKEMDISKSVRRTTELEIINDALGEIYNTLTMKKRDEFNAIKWIITELQHLLEIIEKLNQEVKELKQKNYEKRV